MSSDDFRESGPAEKEALIRKYSMDDALEDIICDLNELYVELAALWPSGFMDTHMELGMQY